jgi:hypothetical protein
VIRLYISPALNLKSKLTGDTERSRVKVNISTKDELRIAIDHPPPSAFLNAKSPPSLLPLSSCPTSAMFPPRGRQPRGGANTNTNIYTNTHTHTITSRGRGSGRGALCSSRKHPISIDEALDEILALKSRAQIPHSQEFFSPPKSKRPANDLSSKVFPKILKDSTNHGAILQIGNYKGRNYDPKYKTKFQAGPAVGVQSSENTDSQTPLPREGISNSFRAQKHLDPTYVLLLCWSHQNLPRMILEIANQHFPGWPLTTLSVRPLGNTLRIPSVL